MSQELQRENRVNAGAVIRTFYNNARLLDPASGLDTMGSVLIEGNKILQIVPNLSSDSIPENIKQFDCEGLCLTPGLIDMRVHLPGPGEEHKETFETASYAAAAGGVTSLICLPDKSLPIDSVSLVEFIARRARETNIVKIFSHGAITRNIAGLELTEFGILSEAGVLGFTDGTKPVADAMVMRRALAYAATFGLLLMQHPEEPDLTKNGQMNEGIISTKLGLTGIPAAAEVIMVERDLRLAELTGSRYHAAHISTAATIAAIRSAKERGLPVTCDTSPHYFTLNDAAVMDYRTYTKVSPPLRDELDRLAVIEGIRDGTIDIIASDHRPQDQDSKRLPFVQAEPGIVGLETLLSLSLTLHHHENMSLLGVLEKMTSAPAHLLDMKEGKLAIGKPADFLIFDPDDFWTVESKSLKSKSKNTPYDGKRLQGLVMHTVVGGRHVYSRQNNK